MRTIIKSVALFLSFALMLPAFTACGKTDKKSKPIYKAVFTLANPVNKAAIKNIFDLLSCKNSYPLVFHCNIGTDRTGAVSFIVLSLLGASREDIFKDYCLSQLAPIGKSVNPDAISGYFKFIDDYYCGKCENYLLDIGITEKQIESIRELLTETK